MDLWSSAWMRKRDICPDVQSRGQGLEVWLHLKQTFMPYFYSHSYRFLIPNIMVSLGVWQCKFNCFPTFFCLFPLLFSIQLSWVCWVNQYSSLCFPVSKFLSPLFLFLLFLSLIVLLVGFRRNQKFMHVISPLVFTESLRHSLNYCFYIICLSSFRS